MFPSSGYFRGVQCPFYASGLCERPYCHFRHTRVEVERPTKPDNGPNYSTSSIPSYQSPNLLGLSGQVSSSVPARHSANIASYSTVGPVSLAAHVESYETLGRPLPTPAVEYHETSEGPVTSNGIPNGIGDSLPIPSFSNSAPALPESNIDPAASVEQLPIISGLPKSRKNLPSYVPTPKTFSSFDDSSTTPSYSPTPKAVHDSVGKKSGHTIEYDPVRNFAFVDKSKSSDEEEGAFSDDDEENNDVQSKNTSAKQAVANEDPGTKPISNGTVSSTANDEDDLTDSDEDVSYKPSTEDPAKDKNRSLNLDALLTPSSFFTEKLAGSSSNSDLNKEASAKVSALPSTLRSSKEDKNKDSSSKSHKSRTERVGSTKSDSTLCDNKKISSSTHRSLSSSEVKKKSSKTTSSSTPDCIKKSSSSVPSSSSHKDGKKPSSSKKDSHNQKSSSSSSSHKPTSSSKDSKSHKSPSLSSTKDFNSHKSLPAVVSNSSSSAKDSNRHKSSSSSSKHKSSTSSHKSKGSSQASSHSSSHTSHKDSSSSSKKDSASKEMKKEKPPSTSSSEKPQGSSSSEKENKQSSHSSSRKSAHTASSSHKSHSSSMSSKSHNHSHIHLEHKSSKPEGKIKSERSEKSDADIKPSVIFKGSKGNGEVNLRPSDNIDVKAEKEPKHTEKKYSKVHHSKLSSGESVVKRERKRSRSHDSDRKEHTSKLSSEKKHRKISESSCKAPQTDFDSDSDIEIIEPPPVPVYNISDSDDNDGDGGGGGGSGGGSGDDSEPEMGLTLDDEDLMSDTDTFDECLRIFQESERQLAQKLKSEGNASCPDKGKLQAETPETLEASEDILASVGKKRMAHANSFGVSRPHKAPVLTRPRLSPAEVMHNRIVEMQKRALLRAAKREGRESDLPQKLSSLSSTTNHRSHTVLGGGLPAASSTSSLPTSGSSSNNNKITSLSPSLFPPAGQKRRQAHVAPTLAFPGHKMPPKTSLSAASSSHRVGGGSGGLGGNGGSAAGVGAKSAPASMSPNSFYSKKKPETSSVTIAGTASKTEKRKAHAPTVSNLKRPLIPAEFGGKVPTNVRQRYLNLIIDEHLKFRSEEQAYLKGQEDEKAVYTKATNKNIYLRVAVNAIMRIRTEAAQSVPSSSKKPCLDRNQLGGSGAHAAQSHAATLGGRNAVRHSYTLNRSKASVGVVPSKIEGKDLYERLSKYIMTESQLRENGYPRPSEDGGSKVQFYKEETGGESLKENERVCRRCGKRFNVTKDGDPISNGYCEYHHGSIYKKRVSGVIESVHSCCSETAGTKGCQVAKYHVHERNKVDNRSGYMKTMPAPPSSEKNYKVYAMDCEMVYTKAGLELARVTVVGETDQVVYESLVKPDTDIIDYNTRFSGITAADMKGVTTNIRGVQAVMLSLVSDKTILIGHSLESDLVALKMIHNTVIDTSIVFPHRLGLPYKRALRNLMLDHLQKIIQADDGGHDSKEDAVACMQLMMFKVKEDIKKEYRRN